MDDSDTFVREGSTCDREILTYNAATYHIQDCEGNWKP
jgi:hypothetical protein